MAWKIEYLNATRKQLKRLDQQVASRIIRFMGERIAPSLTPYALGITMTGEWTGHVRYRVGDYRIICRIQEDQLIVTVVKAGHRSSIYD